MRRRSTHDCARPPPPPPRPAAPQPIGGYGGLFTVVNKNLTHYTVETANPPVEAQAVRRRLTAAQGAGVAEMPGMNASRSSNSSHVHTPGMNMSDMGGDASIAGLSDLSFEVPPPPAQGATRRRNGTITGEFGPKVVAPITFPENGTYMILAQLHRADDSILAPFYITCGSVSQLQDGSTGAGSGSSPPSSPRSSAHAAAAGALAAGLAALAVVLA
jgi:hypothetical protein